MGLCVTLRSAAKSQAFGTFTFIRWMTTPVIWPTDYSVRRSSRATLRSFCFKDSYPFLPLFTGILPTTDAVIVLTQLAKGPGADRSVSEISVLPQHFKMDNLLIGLSFPETRAREVNC